MTIIVHRKSSVAGKKPTASQLVDGEIAVNTIDGKLYTLANGTVKTAGGQWEENGSDIYYDAGNVGIKVDNPLEALHVKGTLVSATINYASNQDKAYLIAGGANWDGDDVNYARHGYQHRIKTNSAGASRITIDTTIGEVWSMTAGGTITHAGDVTANSFIKDGGTSSQYLKADGSTSTDADIVAGKLGHTFTVQGTAFDGSANKSVTFTAGTGISISGKQITNSAPDRTVAFTNGTGISVTGTYPNFTITNTQPASSYNLPLATSSIRGGIKVGFTTSGKNYAVKMSGENAYVNVPWTDNNTTYSEATSSTYGLVKIGYGANGKNYPVRLSSGKMYVNVPWTDNNTTYSEATSSTYGLVKVGFATSGKNYAVQLSSGKMYVNVPWSSGMSQSTADARYVNVSGDTMTGSLTAPDFIATSDERVKDNITTAPVGLVDRLKGREWDWKESGEKGSGVVAQEIEGVLPHLVHTDDEGMKSVSYNGLVAYLIEELKDCRQRIAELESKS